MNLNLQEIDKTHIWHPFTPMIGAPEPIMITSAQGLYLHTADGRRIMDAVSSWWVNLHGHSHPHLAKALAEQFAKLDHVIFAGFTHEPAITLAKNLLTILPQGQSKIFYSDNGSTAVEVGLKMAMQYWHNQGIDNRKKIIAIRGAYHGDTFGAMAVGERGIFTAAFAPYLFEVEFIDLPSAGQEETVLQQFRKSIATNDVAAFIFEPLVQGSAGMRMYTPEILDELLALSKQHDIITIADEVFTGFGRTGRYFATDYLKNKPDIIAISKGITGGTLPLGVTSCTDRIAEAFRSEDILKTFFHGHSYTANPLTCAVANASFEVLTGPECQASIQRISQRHQQFCEAVKNHPNILEARSRGTILALELQHKDGSSYTNELRKKIYPYFLNQNILLRPLGNTIYMLPPYIIQDPELDIIYNAIQEFLKTL